MRKISLYSRMIWELILYEAGVDITAELHKIRLLFL